MEAEIRVGVPGAKGKPAALIPGVAIEISPVPKILTAYTLN